jgi:hypothetical protein
VNGNGNLRRMKAPLNLPIRRPQGSFYKYRRPFWQARAVRRCFLENRRVWRLRKRIGTLDSDANSTGLKAALDLSIQRFQRSFHTYGTLYWAPLVVRRRLLENRRVWRLRKQIGIVDSDADFTRLKAPLHLSIRCFQRRFYTYRRPFWQAPVARRYFLEN